MSCKVIYSVYPLVWKGTGELSPDGKTITATGNTAVELDKSGFALDVLVADVHECEVIISDAETDSII